jgi:hypothetical protein
MLLDLYFDFLAARSRFGCHTPPLETGTILRLHENEFAKREVRTAKKISSSLLQMPNNPERVRTRAESDQSALFECRHGLCLLFLVAAEVYVSRFDSW